MHKDLIRFTKKCIHIILPSVIILSLLVMDFSGCSKSKPTQVTQNPSDITPAVTPEAQVTQEASPDVSPAATQENASETAVRELTAEDTALVWNGTAIPVYVDSKGSDYDGISLAAKAFTEDVQSVTGQLPELVTETGNLKGTVMIAGSVGNNEAIDSLVAAGKLDVSAIQGKWECYKIQVIDNPMEGVDQAVVVAGSDKRGTIYGIYHLSEMIGVSPWVYWADVVPKKQDVLVFRKDELNITSKEPSVKYRGIFLNDENPSLGSWVSKEFGRYNENFYDKVFELILRLKGNYLWPAMWSSNFSEDGESSNTANAAHADAYGIVMGTSHHEPMFRAGVEWQSVYSKYGTSNVWDFSQNKDAITKFWEDSAIRNKDFESIITMGMRGEADSALSGSDEDNINLLKDIIITQKNLLMKYNLQNAPQVLTLYKEVERFWYGTPSVEGLRTWDVLDDVTVMLTEDNFGNVRTLPTKDEKDRKAGWGMYYHFDYHGGPFSYEWINTIPITKVWEQMSMAYDYGVKEIWIANVGDLKPMELPISYFLDLAYDFDTWGTGGINKTEEYTRQWVQEQFGAAVDDAAIDGIAGVLSDYTRMNGKRKPEITYYNTYSFTNYNEAQRVLKEAQELEKNAQTYYDLLPAEYKDSYYQLVYYPAAASANIKKMQIYAGLNAYYYRQKSVLTNSYASLVQECITADTQLQSNYNNAMSGGKWKGMMSSNHIGYVSWNDSGWKYPELKFITPVQGSSMIVSVEGSNTGYTSDIAELPSFTNINKEAYWIMISNGGNSKFDYNIKTSADWIVLDQNQGKVITGDVISVSVDWDKVKQSSEGVITITSGNNKVDVKVKAEVTDTAGFPDMTFVVAHNAVSMEAEHAIANVAKSGVEWKVIDNLGRSLSSLKMFPTDISFEKAEDAPYLEYKLYVAEDADYILTAVTAPTNNLSNKSRLRYAVAFDETATITADTLPADFVAGGSGSWNKGVMENAVYTKTTHKLTKGIHTLRFYGLDAGLVLQKLVLSKGALSYSYFGPEESYYVSKDIVQQQVICHTPDTYYSVPGTILPEDIQAENNKYTTPILITSDGEYQLTLTGTTTTDTKINFKIGNLYFTSIDWKAGEQTVTSANTFILTKKSGILTVEVKSGNPKIDTISFELINADIKLP